MDDIHSSLLDKTVFHNAEEPVTRVCRLLPAREMRPRSSGQSPPRGGATSASHRFVDTVPFGIPYFEGRKASVRVSDLVIYYVISRGCLLSRRYFQSALKLTD